MTIITKPISGQKDDKQAKEPLTSVTSETPPSSSDNGGAPVLVLDENLRRKRRFGLLTSACLLLTSLVAIAFLLAASVQIVRQMRYQRLTRGSCFVPAPSFWVGRKHVGSQSHADAAMSKSDAHSFVSGEFPRRSHGREPLDPEDQGFLVFAPSDDEKPLLRPEVMATRREQLLDTEARVAGLKPVFSPRLASETLTLEEHVRPDGFIEFDYEVDLDFEEFESFEMPEIYGGRYLHDFKANATAIIDVEGRRCFVLPLDREEIPEPRNLMEIISNFRSKAYEVNLEEVRHDTRVVLPPIRDVKREYGHLIADACEHKLSFRLEPVNEPMMVKRSAPLAMGDENSDVDFVEFTGKKMIQYHIVNPEAFLLARKED